MQPWSAVLVLRTLSAALALALGAAGCGGRSTGDFCDGTCVCEQQSTCDGACGNGCDLTCRDASACDITCGDDCATTCERVSTCLVDCDADCDVTCRDLSLCDVVMVTGQVRCERASTCRVGCRMLQGNGIVAATEVEPGLFVCR